MRFKPLYIVFLCISCGAACQPVEDVWRDDDQSVTVKSFGVFGGSFGWRMPRAGLSDQQHHRLVALETVHPKKGCKEDTLSYQIIVTRADRSMEEFRVNEDNAICPDSTDAFKMINYGTFKPFLESLPCIATGRGEAQLVNAPTIRPDDGCSHGFFAYKDEIPRWAKLKIDRPGTYRASLSFCVGKATALELFDATATTSLAKSQMPGLNDDEPCAAITHTFETPGIYALQISSEAVSIGGHVLLQVSFLQ